MRYCVLLARGGGGDARGACRPAAGAPARGAPGCQPGPAPCALEVPACAPPRSPSRAPGEGPLPAPAALPAGAAPAGASAPGALRCRCRPRGPCRPALPAGRRRAPRERERGGPRAAARSSPWIGAAATPATVARPPIRRAAGRRQGPSPCTALGGMRPYYVFCTACRGPGAKSHARVQAHCPCPRRAAAGRDGRRAPLAADLIRPASSRLLSAGPFDSVDVALAGTGARVLPGGMPRAASFTAAATRLVLPGPRRPTASGETPRRASRQSRQWPPAPCAGPRAPCTAKPAGSPGPAGGRPPGPRPSRRTAPRPCHVGRSRGP